MQQDQHNEHGCPLRNQTGAAAVKDFAAIIARLPPEQYAAFEAERDERQSEYEQFVAAYGYHT